LPLATLRDPTGLWSPVAHDILIQTSLQGIASKEDIEAIKAGSRAFDSATQKPWQAFMHSMLPVVRNPEETFRKNEPITQAEAKQMRDDFISQRLADARTFVQAGDRKAALRAFSEAIHPTMDSSMVPLHVDRQGNLMPGGDWYESWKQGHSPNEFIGRETAQYLARNIKKDQARRIGAAYQSVFGIDQSNQTRIDQSNQTRSDRYR